MFKLLQKGAQKPHLLTLSHLKSTPKVSGSSATWPVVLLAQVVCPKACAAEGLQGLEKTMTSCAVCFLQLSQNVYAASYTAKWECRKALQVVKNK